MNQNTLDKTDRLDADPASDSAAAYLASVGGKAKWSQIDKHLVRCGFTEEARLAQKVQLARATGAITPSDGDDFLVSTRIPIGRCTVDLLPDADVLSNPLRGL